VNKFQTIGFILYR